jgi:HEAT repeat protein
MGESADEQWLDYLYEQVQSDDPAFRTAAIAACAVIGSEASVDEVAAFLDDEDQAVAVEAIRALGEIGGDTAAQYLATFEEQVPDDLRGRVRDALEAARGLAPDDAE